MFQIGCQHLQRLACFLFDGESKLGTEPHSTHNAKCIFCKTFQRISHTADNLSVNIFQPAKKVNQSAGRIIRHGINGKITALQVLFKACCKGYLFRMSAILIFAIHPISCNFIAFFLHKDSHGSVLQTCIHCSVKQFLNLLRLRRCSNIPVVRFSSQDRIADTSAYYISLISCIFQYMQNCFRVFWYFQNHMTILTLFLFMINSKNRHPDIISAAGFLYCLTD